MMREGTGTYFSISRDLLNAMTYCVCQNRKSEMGFYTLFEDSHDRLFWPLQVVLANKPSPMKHVHATFITWTYISQFLGRALLE